MPDQIRITMLAFDANRCEIRGSAYQIGHKPRLEVHCDDGAVHPVGAHAGVARIGSVLILGKRSFIDGLRNEITHQETPEMDPSITARRTNPADRLDEACYNLADYKSAGQEQRMTYQLVLLLETLREEADNNPDFDAVLDNLADGVEARMQRLTGAA